MRDPRGIDAERGLQPRFSNFDGVSAA